MLGRFEPPFEVVSFCGIGFQPVEVFRGFDRLEAYPTSKNHSLFGLAW